MYPKKKRGSICAIVSLDILVEAYSMTIRQPQEPPLVISPFPLGRGWCQGFGRLGCLDNGGDILSAGCCTVGSGRGKSCRKLGSSESCQISRRKKGPATHILYCRLRSA